ncbi:unnamed protein product, partial [Mesocestoides corti]
PCPTLFESFVDTHSGLALWIVIYGYLLCFCSLFIPVSLCMFIVAAIAKSVPYFASTEVYLIYTPFNTPNADIGTQTWQTLANVGILLGVVVIMTFLLVLLFKFKCYKCLTGWLVATTFILVFVMSFIEILRASMIFFDNITFAILLWNFGVMGLVSIHWRSPLIVKQAYLIFNSVLMALIFLKYLPKWTCWVLLGAMAIWDLIAVLCPRGPLRMLVEMAQKRNRPLHPAMIYSTTSAYALCARNTGNATAFFLVNFKEDLADREERGVKLGLGDFIFYSLLIGRASLDGDILTAVACYVAILVGMCLTIIALGFAQKALPALPISIACGIVFYFSTATVITPFVGFTSEKRLFF